MVAEGRPEPMSAAPFVPRGRLSLPVLREAASVCRGCDLYKAATQTVFGEGPRRAAVMFIAEQPGDREDLAGRPFVGPAGQVLDRAMTEAGIDRAGAYVTNAVKHFKFELRGTRRIHGKPTARQIGACRPWLEAEIALVAPRLIVLLGATAAQSLLGAAFRVTRERGKLIAGAQWASEMLATVHPSSILRQPDPASRERAYAEFVLDLRRVGERLLAPGA